MQPKYMAPKDLEEAADKHNTFDPWEQVDDAIDHPEPQDS